jgi:hypothetical protein
LGAPSDDDLRVLREGLLAADRDPAELEMVGGMRSPFPDDHSAAPLGPAIDCIPPLWKRGFRTFCIKPNQYIDDLDAYPGWCAEVVERVRDLRLGEGG